MSATNRSATTSTPDRDAAQRAWAEIRAKAKTESADTGHCTWCKMPMPGATSSSICPTCTENQLAVAAVEAGRRAGAGDTHSCRWIGTRYGCPHNADAAYVATVMEMTEL